MKNVKLELLRFLIDSQNKSIGLAGNLTNSTNPETRCEFFNLSGYLTQAFLGIVSFSVLLSIFFNKFIYQ